MSKSAFSRILNPNGNSSRHYSRLRDAISLIHIPVLAGAELFIFKSSVHSSKYLYDELKMFLTIPPHLNIILRPVYLVVRKNRDDVEKIHGIIFKCYANGNLSEVLDCHQNKKFLPSRVKFS